MKLIPNTLLSSKMIVLALVVVLAALMAGSVDAYAPSSMTNTVSKTTTTTTSLQMIKKAADIQRGIFFDLVGNGLNGPPAKSKEEDLMLTIQIILDHERRSTTVPKDQYVKQMREAQFIKKDIQEHPEIYEPLKDVSIPYDARTKLAYEASDKKLSYESFKTKYEKQSIQEVKAKNKKSGPNVFAKIGNVVSKKNKDETTTTTTPATTTTTVIDLSIPYDARTRLAYEATDMKKPYNKFKTQYEKKSIKEVKAKNKKSGTGVLSKIGNILKRDKKAATATTTTTTA